MNFWTRPKFLRARLIYKRLQDASGLVTLAMLASELEVSTRTIQRDLDLLRSCGVITASNRDGFSFQGLKMVKGVCPFCERRIAHRNKGGGGEE